MFRYVQLDDAKIVVGISHFTEEVTNENMILINDLDIEFGSIYDSSTGKFILSEPQPEPEPKASVEQITEETLLETKYQTFLLEMLV